MNRTLSQFADGTSYYFRNYYRSRSFFLMLIVTLLVSSLLTYFSLRYIGKLPKLFPGIPTNLSPSLKERLLGFLWALILLDLPVFASVFFGSPAISGEIENKTAYHIFPLPIARGVLLLSKYFAAVLITLSVLLIYLLFQGGVLLYIFGALPINYFSSIGLLVLFTFSIVAFTFLVSSIFNRNTYAYISVFLIYFLVFEAINVISEFLYKTTPFYLLDNAADIISKVYVNAGTGLFSSSLSINAASSSEIFSSVLIIVIYGVISIVAALIIFQKKEAY